MKDKIGKYNNGALQTEFGFQNKTLLKLLEKSKNDIKEGNVVSHETVKETLVARYFS